MSKIIVAGAGVMTPRYLRPRQAAAYASVSVRAIARAIAAGLVISHLVPGRGARKRVRLIDREDLERFIEGRARADEPTGRPSRGGDGGPHGREASGGKRIPAPRTGGGRQTKEAGQ